MNFVIPLKRRPSNINMNTIARTSAPEDGQSQNQETVAHK